MGTLIVNQYLSKLWTPAEMTTALWLDAADSSTITTVSSAVSEWRDKSGNNRKATQATSASRPTYQPSVQNGKNVIRFTSASSQFLTCVGTAGSFNYLHSGEGLIVTVVKVGTNSNPDTLYPILGNAGSFAAGRRGVSLFWDDRSFISFSERAGFAAYNKNAQVVAISSDNNLLPQSFGIIGASIDAQNTTVSDRGTLLINGSTNANNTGNAIASTGNASFDFEIGDYGTDSFYLEGDVAEVIIVSGTVSELTQKRIEGYLAHKWGLTANLPVTHPYKNIPPYV